MPNIGPVEFLLLVVAPLLLIVIVVVMAGRRSPRAEINWPQQPAPLPGTAATLSERLVQLDEAKAAGLVTEDEYAARRAKILDEG